MKKRSRILVLILTAMLSTEPVQIVYAETAEATHVTSESTSVNPKEENADNSAVVPPKADPGWVAVEKGYQWRQEDGTLLQKSGWVTINGRNIISIRVEFAIQAGRYIRTKNAIICRMVMRQETDG